MEMKQSDEMTISLPKSGKRRKQSTLFPENHYIFFTSEFKIIDNFIFDELMIALRCLFCNNGTLAS